MAHLQGSHNTEFTRVTVRGSSSSSRSLGYLRGGAAGQEGTTNRGEVLFETTEDLGDEPRHRETRPGETDSLLPLSLTSACKEDQPATTKITDDLNHRETNPII